VKKIGKDNQDLNIVLIQGTIGSSAQVGRTKGITEGLAKNPKYHLLAKQTGEFTQAKGQEVMESFLKAYPNIDVVFCENDNEAFGAIDAIKAAGKKPGKDIIIISFDAVHEAFNRMIAGEINCACECNPLHGPRVADIIKSVKVGETPCYKSRKYSFSDAPEWYEAIFAPKGSIADASFEYKVYI
jgi:simple sugar transport system substrate-binding protein